MDVNVSPTASRKFVDLQYRLVELGDQALLDESASRLVELLRDAKCRGACSDDPKLTVYRTRHVKEIGGKPCLLLFVRNVDSANPTIERVRLLKK